jgi:hypothetical protein
MNNHTPPMYCEVFVSVDTGTGERNIEVVNTDPRHSPPVCNHPRSFTVPMNDGIHLWCSRCDDVV